MLCVACERFDLPTGVLALLISVALPGKGGVVDEGQGR
jgi:hypothetical protein